MRAKRPLTVHSYMTPSPHSIAPYETIAKAHEVMRGNAVRHLPVVTDGRLVGVVSQRDLAIMESLPGVNPTEVPVEDAMSTDVYTAAPSAHLREVVAEMAARKVGSAVIMDVGRVVGLFTTFDALEALAVVLASVEA